MSFDFSKCPGICARIRHQMVMENHPILAKMHETPAPTMIPVEQALAMDLEARDQYRQRLAEIEAEIKILRDCAGI